MKKPNETDQQKTSGLLRGSEPLTDVRYRSASKKDDDGTDSDTGDDDTTDSDKTDSDATDQGDKVDKRDADGRD